MMRHPDVLRRLAILVIHHDPHAYEPFRLYRVRAQEAP